MSPRLLLASLAAVFIGIALLLFHQKARQDARSMEAAVDGGLKRLYRKLATQQTQRTNATTFTAEALTQVLRDELGQHRLFPGFTKTDDVSVSTIGVARGTSNLLFVIQPWKNVRCGVDGNGNCRKVGGTEYQNWPHTTLNQKSE